MATGYCPFCAAQSWPLIIALSHFGQFSGLNVSRSPTFEGIPPVDGWTFYGSSYTSRYLAFAPVETYSNVLVSPKANPADRDQLPQAAVAHARRAGRLPPARHRRADPVHRFRRQGLGNRLGHRPDRADRPYLDPDRGRPAPPRQHRRRGHPRLGQRADLRAVPAHRRPPGRRVPENRKFKFVMWNGPWLHLPRPPSPGGQAAPAAILTSGLNAADGSIESTIGTSTIRPSP